MQDVADAISDRFGGAAGIADIFYEQLFDENTTGATKAKILSKMADYLASTSKQYGDRERLAGMNTQQIEKRLLQLLVKYDMVVPIPGIELNVGQTPKEGEAERQSPSASTGSQSEDREPAEREGDEPAGEVD